MSSNQKIDVALDFQKHQYTAHQNIVDEDNIDDISLIITKCCFTIGSLIFKQEIAIAVGIDRALFR